MSRRKKQEVWPTLKRFAPYLRPHSGKMVLAVFLVLVVACIQVVFPRLIGIIIDELNNHRAGQVVYVTLGIFALALIARMALLIWRNLLTQQIAMRVTCDMRIQLFQHLQKLSLRFYQNSRTGKIVSRITEDTGSLHVLVANVAVNMASDLITILAMIAVMLWINVQLTLVTMIVLPFFIFNYVWHRRRMRYESRRHRNNWDRVIGFLYERVANSQIVMAFASENREIEHFRNRIERDYDNYNRVVRRNVVLGTGAEFLSGTGTLLVLAFGSYLVIHDGRFTVGDLVAFYTYLGMLYAPILRMVDSNAMIQKGATSAEKIFTLLDTQPHIPDNDSLPAMPPAKGRVEFANVTFDYRPGIHTLEGVSLTVEPGEMIALVGPSGAGKSTIVTLLARFYDPTSGAILIDGQDIRQFNVQTLRRQVGIVMQDSILFAGTIADNIKYGRPSATDEEMIEAARAANAHEFITEFENGYQSIVGERGVQISGGQRQRIAIARVILKDPRILIFDEATSALDTHSERLVQEATERLMKNRTSIVIAHRLSTVVNADRIVVMQSGHIVETGPHAELVLKNGLYRELYDLQFSRTEAAAPVNPGSDSGA